MTPDLLRRVRTLRSAPFPMGLSTAVQIARYETAETAYPFLADLRWDDHAAGELDGFDVVVTARDDIDSQLGEDDVTGTFGDHWAEGAIRNDANGRDWHDNGAGCDWYYPSAYDLQHLHDDLKRAGMSRGVAEDTYRAVMAERIRDDRERAYYLLHVVVSLDGEELADEYLGGVDIISDRTYLADAAAEMIDETLERAREALPKRADQHAERAEILRRKAGQS